MLRLLMLQLTLGQTLDTRTRRDDRASVTIEHVLWAVAVIGIVAIVIAAVRAYVETQAGNIR